MGSLSRTKRRSGDAQKNSPASDYRLNSFRTDPTAGVKVNHKIQHFGFRKFLYSSMKLDRLICPKSEQRFRDEVRGLTGAGPTVCRSRRSKRVNRYGRVR